MINIFLIDGMIIVMSKLLLFFFLVFYIFSNSYAYPPYSGTIFPFSDIINSNDPSTFQELIYVGQDHREMYDRRQGGSWITKKVFLFNAIYKERIIEIQVNPEFKNLDNAFQEAFFYSEIIGRLPNFLLLNLKTVWIHKGNKDYGGGNQNLLIHIGRSKEYIRQDILEEVFIHEGGHSSLDWAWDGVIDKIEWNKAAKKDEEYISKYAKNTHKVKMLPKV